MLNPRQFDQEAEDILGALGGAPHHSSMNDNELLYHLKSSHGLYHHVDSIPHMDQKRREAFYGVGAVPKRPRKNDPVIKNSSRKALEGAHDIDHGPHDAWQREGRKRHSHGPQRGPQS